MSYTEAPKTADYIGVLTTVPPQAQRPTNVYTFPGPAVGEPVPAPPPLDVISPRQMKKMAKKQKRKERKEKKKKGSLLLCCSNFEIDDEDGKEKIREVLENKKKRISLVMCCSNLEVGSKKDVNGFGK
ncbi:hypothetical protein SLEP1_g14558 [Rubroshorea leprosula]|uniref:Uncharacterized protein n=1 Tax=Rubroshorea leprosula TaxID=152421 RepID=A0AAV5IJG4_9ROSI|nr:hypothetical protein SLEP1_g14558 [Rubroshorea leprosula]